MSGLEVNIKAAHNRSKFTIAHEIGHAVFNEHLPGYPSAASDASLNRPAPCDVPADVTESGHAAASVEFSGNAFSEGFADYFSALTYNNVAQADCALSGPGDVINCRDGSSGDEVHGICITGTACFTSGG